MEKYYLYIILTRPNTVISRLIQLVKGDEYTHAAISLDKRLDNMYSFGRIHPYNPIIGRFKSEDINKGIYKFHKNLPGAILEIEVSKDQYENAKALLNHFVSNRKIYRYNYKGLLHSLFNKGAYSENRFLCSEFVYYILKESGIADLKIPGNLVRPQSLLHLKARVIYKGNLKEVKLKEDCRIVSRIRVRGLNYRRKSSLVNRVYESLEARQLQKYANEL